MYDFANSGYTTVVLTTVFSAYFVGSVAAGRSWGTLALTCALSLSYLLVMLTMPSLGARADARAAKRRLLFTSTVGCVIATALLGLTRPGDILWGLVFVAVSNYCYSVGESSVAAFLPEIARREALGRVSGWGWSFGYVGGMLTLGLSIALVNYATGRGLQTHQAVAWVMLLTAAIFAIAALPSFLFLRERTPPSARPVEKMLVRLASGWRDTRDNFPDFRRLLMCCTCYQAGISVVITLSSVYATQAMGFTIAQTMVLIFVVNIAAAIGAFLFGFIQDRIGHKRALTITLCGWMVMVLLASQAVSAAMFWVAAMVAGLCMGTSQSAGRAMVGALAPSARLAEFYSLWTFATQLASVVGPLFYGLVSWLTGGNHRMALLCTGLFFVAALIVLSRLDFARGVRVRDTIAV
ncbi:MFS transporter [Allopusillimonas soli]|uniref:MFS transporter n=1 Tax=Allopusillimonas soli TaxID=659016 RepID=A0A853FEC3_9BURK|nr:MFS transporter [Allopusillimonas soli]NYT38239.1 MFS transporter [Allopusillimonas soli]TEA72252.1 MFS transporter [Allopusillimonas soli]